jgi:hypothetical protein
MWSFIGKKRAVEFGHGDILRHRSGDGYRKDADRKIGGPRRLVKTPAALAYLTALLQICGTIKGLIEGKGRL